MPAHLANKELHGMDLNALKDSAQMDISSIACPTSASPKVLHAAKTHIGMEQSASVCQDSTKSTESVLFALQRQPTTVQNAPVKPFTTLQ